MSLEHVCDMCGNPVEEAAYVCHRCTDGTAARLRGAELAGEVETTVALLARYASRGGAKPAEPVPADTPDAPEASQPVLTFGWQASIERPARGALRPGRLIFDPDASERAAEAFNDITTWARAVEDDRGEPVPVVRRGEHPVAVAALWLLGQLDWMRHQRYAAEAFGDLREAGSTILQIVDRPPDYDLAGICACGVRLYVRAGATVVTCPDCGTPWDAGKSRDILREAARDFEYSASAAADLLVIFGIKGNRERARKLVAKWGERGHIETRGEVVEDGKTRPTYRFGDVLDCATRHEQQNAA